MRIYVAGKWEDRGTAAVLMDALRGYGHTITCDWTDHKYEDEAYPTEYAMDDIEGVLTAELYIGIFQKDYSYRGALVEFGIAIGKGIPVWIIGHAIDSCIFTAAPGVRKFENMTAFLMDGLK